MRAHHRDPYVTFQLSLRVWAADAAEAAWLCSAAALRAQAPAELGGARTEREQSVPQLAAKCSGV